LKFYKYTISNISKRYELKREVKNLFFIERFGVRGKRKTYVLEIERLRELEEAEFNDEFVEIAKDEIELENLISVSEEQGAASKSARDLSFALLGMLLSVITWMISTDDTSLLALILFSAMFCVAFGFFIGSLMAANYYYNFAMKLKDNYKKKCLSDNKGTLSERMVAFAAIKQATVEAEAKLETVNTKINDAEAELKTVNEALDKAKADLNKSN